MKKVLLTGATGEVARGVIPHLESHFDLRLTAPEAPDDDPRFLAADLMDWQALEQAMCGVDAVLHLAIAGGHSGTFEEDAFNDLRFSVNVTGTYHVLELAKRLGIRRVVQVSSLMVVWGHGTEEMVSGDAPPRPVGTYALTKSLAEQVAEHYARSEGIEALTLRIAAPLDIDDPQLKKKKVRPQQVPFPDLAQAFRLALTVPWERYEIVTIVGESSRRRWSLEPARRVLGYDPQYRLDDLGVSFAPPQDVEPT